MDQGLLVLSFFLQAKLMENSHAWLGASTSSIAGRGYNPQDQTRPDQPRPDQTRQQQTTGNFCPDQTRLDPISSYISPDYSSLLKMKAPTWNQSQLREAMYAVITQKMRFTQASTRYNIPKGTLYDNILGKSNRMQVLDEAGLTTKDEQSILEFCCDVSISPYNRRTKKPLSMILEFVQRLIQDSNKSYETDSFEFQGKNGYRWWWAFCKKYSIVSLYYDSSVGVESTS